MVTGIPSFKCDTQEIPSKLSKNALDNSNTYQDLRELSLQIQRFEINIQKIELPNYLMA
jgi:hypothetical protein